MLLLCVLHTEFPAVAVGVVEPETDVGRGGTLRADFVARIFDIGPDLLQVSERFSQDQQVGQMK